MRKPTPLKTPCILWKGAKTSKGYGVRCFRGHNTTAHRAAWIEKYGPIPRRRGSRRILVCHDCDNPPCVNLDHLFLGTNAINMQDASRKGRMKGNVDRHGERHGRATMTDAQVVAARTLKRAGLHIRKIAVAAGLPFTRTWHSRLRQAIGGRTFKHLPL